MVFSFTNGGGLEQVISNINGDGQVNGTGGVVPNYNIGALDQFDEKKSFSNNESVQQLVENSLAMENNNGVALNHMNENHEINGGSLDQVDGNHKVPVATGASLNVSEPDEPLMNAGGLHGGQTVSTETVSETSKKPLTTVDLDIGSLVDETGTEDYQTSFENVHTKGSPEGTPTSFDDNPTSIDDTPTKSGSVQSRPRDLAAEVSYLERRVFELSKEVEKKQFVVNRLKGSLADKEKRLDKAEIMHKRVLDQQPLLEESLRELELKKKEIAKLESAIFAKNLELMEKEKLEKSMREELLCPVCLTVPKYGKIPTCQNGHITCEACKSAQCPTCKVSMAGEARYSYLAQNLTELLEFPCKHEGKGCTSRLIKKAMLEHEENKCRYTENIICPGRDCPTLVSHNSLEQHVLHCRFLDTQQSKVDTLELGKEKNIICKVFSPSAFHTIVFNTETPREIIFILGGWPVKSQLKAMRSPERTAMPSGPFGSAAVTSTNIASIFGSCATPASTVFGFGTVPTLTNTTASNFGILAAQNERKEERKNSKEGRTHAFLVKLFSEDLVKSYSVRMRVRNPANGCSRAYEGRTVPVRQNTKTAIEEGNVLEIPESTMMKMVQVGTLGSSFAISLTIDK